MASYAVLAGDTVTNIIIADTKEVAEEVTNAECIECNNGSIKPGDSYDRESQEFVLQAVPVVEEPTE
jgi:hypothetical protein